MEKALIFTVNMKVFAFLPDSPLFFCGLETQVVCWNLAGCNEKCRFIWLHNRSESWEGLRFVSAEITAQFLDRHVQGEVLSVQDGMEALVSLMK